jgi:23S rRNA (adenine1618-N6)-methyltransferase
LINRIMCDTDLTQLPPYYNDIDFKTLAKKDEAFKAQWQKCSGYLDFQDPAATLILSKAILNTDFGLTLELPEDRLCPTIPNRWNYVSWIQNLLDSTSPNYTGHYDPARKVIGLDIGTGASAIYPMLCLQSRPNWTMCATDIDKKSFDSAVRNLTINNLVTRTKMIQTIPSNPLIPLQHLGVDILDFTICNPPFFTSESDMRSSLKGEGKSWTPNAACTGAPVEMVCPGGDLGFVTRIVEESLILKQKVRWYTSMFGKLDTAKAIVTLLKSHGIDNWAVGVIEAGMVTKRWIVAWSFADYRPRNDVARIEKIANEFLPFPTEYRFALLPDHDVGAVAASVDKQLGALDLRWMWDAEACTGVGEAAQIVWNRAYRREHERRKRDAAAGGASNADSHMAGQDEDVNVALAFRVSVVGGETREVVIEWLRGTDRVLWESFCGMLHRGFKKP